MSIERMGTGKSDIQVMIEKDWDKGFYIFTFASSKGWHDIYEMIGRFYYEIGKNQIESCEVDENSNKWAKILIVKIHSFSFSSKEDLIYVVLNHWYQVERWMTFSFCPVNFDITLAAKNPPFCLVTVKAGDIAKYENLSYSMD